MNPDDFDRCMNLLAASWPHSRQTPETFELAELLLTPLPFEAVMGALAQMALEGREHAPPVGQIAKRAAELIGEANGEHLPDVEEALREVLTAISRVGIYRTPEWSHPAIGDVIEALGGWEATCLDDNPEAYRAHFLRLYGTARARVEKVGITASVLAQVAPGLNLSADRALGDGR